MNSIDAEGDEGTPDTMYGGFGQDVLFADNGDVLSGGAHDGRFQILAVDSMDPVTITDFSDGDELYFREWILKGSCDGFRYLSFISSSLNASVGVLHPRHFLGVPFRRSQIDFISRFESVATGASLGK